VTGRITVQDVVAVIEESRWELLQTKLAVEWVDSQRFGLEWAPVDDLKAETEALASCLSVGLLGSLSDTTLTLILTYDEENGNYNGAISIPLVAVRRATVLEERSPKLSVVNRPRRGGAS
jgi:hypothetical protein